MALQHAIPEDIGKTPIGRMRLIDMRRVAAAWDITIDQGAVADKIRPTLINSEGAGTFLKPCPHPERLQPQGYTEWMKSDALIEAGPTKSEMAIEIEKLKNQLDTSPTTNKTSDLTEGDVKWRGPTHKFCKVVDGEWVTGFASKEEASK